MKVQAEHDKDASRVGMTTSSLSWLVVILNDLALSGGFDVLRFDAPRFAYRLSGGCRRLNATPTPTLPPAWLAREGSTEFADREKIYTSPPRNKGIPDCLIGGVA